MKEQKKKADKLTPEFVNIRKADGSIQKVSYRKVLEREEMIIQDNVIFGLKNQDRYPDEEIKDYQKRARKQLEELKQSIQENPNIILKMDWVTERYMPEEASKE